MCHLTVGWGGAGLKDVKADPEEDRGRPCWPPKLPPKKTNWALPREKRRVRARSSFILLQHRHYHCVITFTSVRGMRASRACARVLYQEEQQHHRSVSGLKSSEQRTDFHWDLAFLALPALSMY